jgi:hypothetical protein|tara:strand:- start:9774 stop:9911 length:138 start_codon:yes stop_codon:yes gene_type:complete
MNRRERKEAKLAKQSRENESVGRVEYLTDWHKSDPDGFYRYFGRD